MTTSWQGVLFSALLALAGAPAIAYQPSAQPPEPSALCPPVVQDFLEAIGLLPGPLAHTRPIVLIDVQGHPLDCLPRVLPPQLHDQVAEFIHQGGIIMSKDSESSPVCLMSEGSLENVPFIGLIVSYDLAQMKSPMCLHDARKSLGRLSER